MIQEILKSERHSNNNIYFQINSSARFTSVAVWLFRVVQ